MNTTNATNELTTILKHFNKITGLKLTVFDTMKNVIAEYPKNHCSFCEYINSLPLGKIKCETCNWNAFSTCQKSKEIQIYECHMGLTEVTLPLIENEHVIGFLMLGQVKNDKTSETILKKIKECKDEINLDPLVAEALISSVKYHSHSYLSAEIKISQICCTYILSQHIIPYKKSLYDEIIEYINNTDLRDLKIKNICESLNVSRTFIYTTFAKYNEIGIAEYIRDLKIKKAILLLTQNKHSIKEIAYITGFTDSNHFIKVFKSYIGKTPKEFQKNRN